MSKTPNPAATFESSLAQGRSIGASAEEVKKIHDLVKQVKHQARPTDVRSFELNFGSDSTGDPAVWVWFLVQEDQNPSAEKIARLDRFAKAVRDALLGANIKYWPYVDFRAVA
jgi:hypothetical protein